MNVPTTNSQPHRLDLCPSTRRTRRFVRLFVAVVCAVLLPGSVAGQDGPSSTQGVGPANSPSSTQSASPANSAEGAGAAVLQAAEQAPFVMPGDFTTEAAQRLIPTDTSAARGLSLCGGAVNAAPLPELQYTQAAILLDAMTETVLYELRGDVSWAPASLTKLVSIATALAAAEDGRFELDEPAPVDPRAYASSMPPGSSLMFLGPDQLVNGRDLLYGLSVSSGNDAAVEVALRVSGSVSAFAAEMNALVRNWGFPELFFEEPSGLSPGNQITARSFARFSARLMREWPEFTGSLFAVPVFSYPEDRHYPGSSRSPGTITQFNRNTLLATFSGTDGLKTGFIEESGYNLAVSAVRDQRRLIAVLLGTPAVSHAQGGARRSQDATALLQWGFDAFTALEMTVPEVAAPRVWGGRTSSVALERPLDIALTLPSEAVANLAGRVERVEHVWAPIAAGTVVAEVIYEVGSCEVSRVPIRTAEPVERAGVVRRILDRVRWWWARLTGGVASDARVLE